MKKVKNELYENIGKIIRENRSQLGLTLEELGEKVHRDWSYLSQLERGRAVPSIDTLVRIADCFDISLSELFAKTEKKKGYKKDPYVNQIAYILRDKDSAYKRSVAKLLSNLTKKGK